MLGPRLAELATAAGEDRLLAVAQPILIQLRDLTGESAQLYRRQGDSRICVAAAERATGLRDTVPVGVRAAHDRRLGRPGPARLGGAGPDAPGPAGGPVHRHLPGPGPAPRLGRQRRRARGRGGVGVRAGPRPGRQDHRRRLGLRAHRAPDPLPRPAARRRRGRRRARRSAPPSGGARYRPAPPGPRPWYRPDVSARISARLTATWGPRCTVRRASDASAGSYPRRGPAAWRAFRPCAHCCCAYHVRTSCQWRDVRPCTISSPDCDAAFQVTPPGNMRSRP